MMMRLFAVCAVVGTLLAGVSCNDSAPAPGAGGKMKVGLLVTGSTSDGGWNQLAKSSLDSLAGPEDIEVHERENVSKDAAADAIRKFDSEGYSLVIAHGYEYLEAAKELTDPAKGTPVKVKVVVSGGDVDSPNFQSLDYDLVGASYQIGIIAAKVSKTGKLGFIGGEKIPTVVVMQRGFEAGAKSVNPSATFSEAYPGWDDPSKSKAQAEAFMAQGVDVIMQNVDTASRGVFEAVKEQNAKSVKYDRPVVYTFGANSDQNGNAVCGDYTLASAVIKLDKAFDKAIKEVKGNTFKGGLVKEDLRTGVCVTVLNPKLVGKVIDKQTEGMVEAAGKELSAGGIKIP